MHNVNARVLASRRSHQVVAGMLSLLGAGVLELGLARPAAAQASIDQAIPLDIPGVAVEPGVTVTSRRRPDYEYSGVRLGSYLVVPELSESVGYDDNVLGTRRKQGSAVVQTRGDIQANSDLARTVVAARITVDDNRYLSQPRQSFTNWTAQVSGAHDLGRDTVALAYSHVNQTQTPRDLNAPQLQSSLAYRIDTLQGDYRAVFNRLSLRPDLQVSLYDFDNGVVAGQPYRQDYRNRVTIGPSLTANYELAPRRDLVLVVRNLTASYTIRPDGFVNRDFNDSSVLAGIDYEADGLWRYRALVGYEVRQFTSPTLKSIQAPIAEASVIFTPTGLTTLTGTVARRIQDSADETTVGLTESSVKLVVDHEYKRNVLLTANAQATLDEYNRGGGNQVRYTVGAGATWLLNRNMRLGARYDFVTLRSNSTGNVVLSNGFPLSSGYNENRVLLQLRVGL